MQNALTAYHMVFETYKVQFINVDQAQNAMLMKFYRHTQTSSPKSQKKSLNLPFMIVQRNANHLSSET